MTVKPVVERFPFLAKAGRYVWDNWQMNEKPKVTPFGFLFSGDSVMQAGQFEPRETRLVQKILERMDVFVNVGANIGYYCCVALQMKKPVVAFEPVATNLKYLYKNIVANQWQEQVEVFPLALSNKTGLVCIFGGGTGASLVKGWANAPDYFMDWVPCVTLDSVIGERLRDRKSLVLVDIEGAERLMLEGAGRVLRHEPKPVWLVEICVAEHQPKGTAINPNLHSTFTAFWSEGYEAFAVGNQLRPVQPEEVEQIVRTGKDTLPAHNFLFIEKSRAQEWLAYLEK